MSGGGAGEGPRPGGAPLHPDFDVLAWAAYALVDAALADARRATAS